MAATDDLTAEVKSLALEAGFSRVGIAPGGAVEHNEGLRRWLDRGLCAGMDYMSRNVEKRLQPELLVPGARSVICLAVGYAPADAEDHQLVARYARGRDYHKVLKNRCMRLMDRIRQLESGFAGRAFADSAPVMERTLAALGGLGWIGANGCLIIPQLGSYVLLCEIICNLPLRPDEPIDSQCDNCHACQEACPTGAILDKKLVDSGRCISYLTIEHRGPVNSEYWPLMGQHLAGCDACQKACPFNRDLPAGEGELLGDGPPLGGASLADVLSWNHSQWDSATRGSAVRRVSLEMFQRNAVIAAGNSGDGSLIGPLRRLGRERTDLAGLIDWAVGRLGRD